MRNTGHRLGASGTNLENTIQGLKNKINNLDDKNFKYWEFDIRESSDGVIFVFHDDVIKLDNELVEISKMSFLEIKEAGRKLDISIPTFEEVVTELEKRKEKVMIEIKEIFSDEAKYELIKRTSGHENWKIMATPERFEKSFPKDSRDFWAEQIRNANIELVRVGRHRVDLFTASKSYVKWLIAKPKWLFGL
mgnify:FL=1|jgi:glycerophosphoryl diester phosphodiesterase